MKASTVYPSLLDESQAYYGPLKSQRIVHAEADLGRYGVFAFEVKSFNTFKSRTEKSFNIEVWTYDADGNLEELQGLYNLKNKSELLKQFNNFQIK